MLLADDSSRRAPIAGSANAALTSRWQSSKVPSTDSDLTLPPQQVSCRSCRGETRPRGNSTTTSMPGRPWNAAATAPPVSPEVATRIVSVRRVSRCSRPRHAARKRAPKSLKAAVGPWKSSSTAASPSVASGTSGTGKSKASRTIAASSGASTSSSKNGARKRVATGTSALVPSKSAALLSGKRSGTYSPPSGARPRCRAPDSVAVSLALRVEM